MRITVSIPDKLSENLKLEAHNLNISVSRLVSDALEHYLLDLRRKTLGRKVLELAGEAYVSPDADSILDEGRRNDRS